MKISKITFIYQNQFIDKNLKEILLENNYAFIGENHFIKNIDNCSLFKEIYESNKNILIDILDQEMSFPYKNNLEINSKLLSNINSIPDKIMLFIAPNSFFIDKDYWKLDKQQNAYIFKNNILRKIKYNNLLLFSIIFDFKFETIEYIKEYIKDLHIKC